MATVSKFGHHLTVDLDEGFPLLTTKQLDGFRWNSLIHEFLWYLSGEEHIRNLQEKTSIWDDWANEKGQLDTAYGRFWRRYPIPSTSEEQLPGESWAVIDGKINQGRWKDSEEVDVTDWINKEQTEDGDVRYTFDQLQYVIDMLQHNQKSRRIIVSAWHPANATISTLPPCHYTFVFNVQNGKLNTHLTQRSGDIALGVPFNIAAYSLLTHILANEADLEVGKFSHTIVDAHIYCGQDERGGWYNESLTTIRDKLNTVENQTDSSTILNAVKDTFGLKNQKPTAYSDIAEWIEQTAPQETEKYDDHIPQLLRQLDRTPYEKPSIEIADKELENLTFEDINLENYISHGGLKFKVAE
jgi:thymidylate synthase